MALGMEDGVKAKRGVKQPELHGYNETRAAEHV